MTSKEFADKELDRIVGKIKQMRLAKGHDYANDADTFANYRKGESAGIPAWFNMHLRLQEKSERINQYFDKGELMVVDDSIEDSIMDQAIIALNIWIEYNHIKQNAEPKMRKAFICSPYSSVAKDVWEMQDNADLAKEYAKYALDMGYIPIVPHIYFPQFLNEFNGVDRNIGMTCGLELLKDCDEMWVFNYIEESVGMNAEIDCWKNMTGEEPSYMDDHFKEWNSLR